MKYNFVLLLITFIGGCYSTETTSLLHAELNREVKFLHERHIETIDAYSQSLKAANAQLTMAFEVMNKTESERASALNQQNLSKREAWVKSVVSQFDQRVYDEITATFDQKIEDVFWPDIVDKQEEYRDKADALKGKLKAHQCNKSSSGCSDISFDNYRKLAEQFREYSTLSEHIIHLGYKEESVIWQRLAELTHQFRNHVKAQARQVPIPAITESDKTILLKQEISVLEDRLNNRAQELQQERDTMNQHWAVTKQALVLLRADVDKPEIWELILEGVTERTTEEVTTYTSKIGAVLGSVLGKPAGDVVAFGLSETANQLVDASVTSMGSALDALFKNAKHKIHGEITTLLNANKTSI